MYYRPCMISTRDGVSRSSGPEMKRRKVAAIVMSDKTDELANREVNMKVP
jgi:hypothetical protein